MRRLFSLWMKQVRKKRGLTQAQLAEQAQIAARTIRYWETGQFSPREPELLIIFRILEVTPEERAEGLALLTTAWNLRRECQPANKNSDPCDLLYGLGDLLTAMRMRHGWRQEQLADYAKVSRHTITRWESGRVLPSEDNLLRICTLLQATAEEREALRKRRLSLPGWSAQLTLEECEEKFDLLYQRVVNKCPPMLDLHFLALKRQICNLPPSAAATRLLVNCEATHGGWLSTQDQGIHAFHNCKRALDLSIQAISEDMEIVWALNVMGHCKYAHSGDPKQAINLICRWLSLLPPNLQLYPRCDMALYASYTAPEEGAALLKEAFGFYKRVSKEREDISHYFRVTGARINLKAGKPEMALALLPPPPSDVTLSNISPWLTRAETLLAAGEREAASACLHYIESQGLNFVVHHCPQRYQTIVRQLQ